MALSTICPRRGDLQAWTTVNPVVESGELVVEYPETGIGTGTCKFKIGDGKTRYNDLPYAFDGGAASSIDGGSSSDTDSHKIQLRSDTAKNWEINNPVLSYGEIGYDSTNNSFKVGDGLSAWLDLEYSKADILGDIDCGFEG